jgi:hypothetical protein
MLAARQYFFENKAVIGRYGLASGPDTAQQAPLAAGIDIHP